MENMQVDTIENIKTNINKFKLVILLDAGHGIDVKGKKAPDNSFYEYEFNKDIVDRIDMALTLNNTPHHIINPETVDISLTERANRINRYCAQYGPENCLLISVHANAAGNGSWMNARGWSVYTTKGLTNSDKYATLFYNEANLLLPKYGQKLRADWSDNDPDWEENFTIIYKSRCPAILTENLFYDNKQDLEFLKSNQGRAIISQIHINAIKKASSI